MADNEQHKTIEEARRILTCSNVQYDPLSLRMEMPLLGLISGAVPCRDLFASAAKASLASCYESLLCVENGKIAGRWDNPSKIGGIRVVGVGESAPDPKIFSATLEITQEDPIEFDVSGLPKGLYGVRRESLPDGIDLAQNVGKLLRYLTKPIAPK